MEKVLIDFQNKEALKFPWQLALGYLQQLTISQSNNAKAPDYKGQNEIACATRYPVIIKD